MIFTLLGLVIGLYIGFSVLIYFIFPGGAGQMLAFHLLPKGILVNTIFLTTLILSLFGILGALSAYLYKMKRAIRESLRKFKEASEVSKTKDEFISVVLHHLRTPLSGIRWSLEEILKEETITKDVKDKLERLSSENNRALTAIEHLIGASQASMGRITYEMEIINIADMGRLIQEAIMALTPMAQAKNISITTEISPETSESKDSVKIDKEKITTVIQTFLENAVHYTPGAGSIKIRTEIKKSDFVFSITDSGIEIEEKDKPKIFSEFFRAENAKRFEPAGFGIGLFLAKTFIENQQGKIGFDSVPGKGTTFIFSIPILKGSTEKFLEEVG